MHPPILHYLLLRHLVVLLFSVIHLLVLFLRSRNFIILDELGIFVQRRAEVDQIAQHLLPTHRAQTCAFSGQGY